jgi:hypothetical protein
MDIAVADKLPLQRVRARTNHWLISATWDDFSATFSWSMHI